MWEKPLTSFTQSNEMKLMMKLQNAVTRVFNTTVTNQVPSVAKSLLLLEQVENSTGPVRLSFAHLNTTK